MVGQDRRRDHGEDRYQLLGTRGLAVVPMNTGEFHDTGVETVDPWTTEPQ